MKTWIANNPALAIIFILVITGLILFLLNKLFGAKAQSKPNATPNVNPTVHPSGPAQTGRFSMGPSASMGGASNTNGGMSGARVNHAKVG